MWLMLTIGLDGTDLLPHSRVLLLRQLLSPLLHWLLLMQDSMSVPMTSIPRISQAVQLSLKLLLFQFQVNNHNMLEMIAAHSIVLV